MLIKGKYGCGRREPSVLASQFSCKSKTISCKSKTILKKSSLKKRKQPLRQGQLLSRLEGVLSVAHLIKFCLQRKEKTMLYCLFTPPQPHTHPHPKASLEPLKVRHTEAEGQELTFNLHTNERPGPPSFPPITLLCIMKLLDIYFHLVLNANICIVPMFSIINSPRMYTKNYTFPQNTAHMFY